MIAALAVALLITPSPKTIAARLNHMRLDVEIDRTLLDCAAEIERLTTVLSLIQSGVHARTLTAKDCGDIARSAIREPNL